jgi:hypothetical protein
MPRSRTRRGGGISLGLATGAAIGRTLGVFSGVALGVSLGGLSACGGAQPGAPRCPLDRTILLDSQAAVERFAGCRTASSITIRTGAELDLSPLGALETITGDFVVGPTIGLEELFLRELRSIGGTLRVSANNQLRGVLLPRLEQAGRISIEGNASLTTVSMPRLAQVLGSLVITEDGSLELVALPALTRIGKDLVIAGNPVLGLVQADRLTEVLEVRIEGNRQLPAEQVEALRAIAKPASTKRTPSS